MGDLSIVKGPTAWQRAKMNQQKNPTNFIEHFEKLVLKTMFMSQYIHMYMKCINKHCISHTYLLLICVRLGQSHCLESIETNTKQASDVMTGSLGVVK